MATGTPKLALNASRDIPLNKLVASPANVRRIKAGVSVEELAEDIARRGLLQSLSVRPLLDGAGQETGRFEVTGGGRRLKALHILVKGKRLSKVQPVPCVVQVDHDTAAEEDSLAENVQRAPLHPLDQFRAFRTLREERGMQDEEIAAAFFVSPQVVKQRLRLTAVSENLLALYAEDAMSLEQLMAFTVSNDHARQEQVWESVQRGWNKEAYLIRRMMTEGKVQASERRAVFVGPEAYEAAGGSTARDLFQQDAGGWFEDVALLDRLVDEKLQAEADKVVAEGWKWVEVARDFAFGHTQGLRRIHAIVTPLVYEEQERLEALQEEMERLEAEHAGTGEDLPEDADRRLGELEAEIALLNEKPGTFEPEALARAGAFMSLGHDGRLRVERGYVRPEDEAPAPVVDGGEADPHLGTSGAGRDPTGSVPRVTFTVGGVPAGADASSAGPEEEGDRPLTERLMTELTTHRTMALRDALARDPDAAFLAVLHAMVLRVFGSGYGTDSCLELQLKVTVPDRSVPGLAEAPAANALVARKEAWGERVPGRPKAVWDFLLGLDGGSRADLFALCAGLSVNAMHLPHDRRPDAIAHADRVAELVGLDMADHWQPTAETFFGRVTKGRILAAVREAKGEGAAQLIDHLKKADMAAEAERFVQGTRWLPHPLRTPGQDGIALVQPGAGTDHGADADGEPASPIEQEGCELPAFLNGEDDGEAEGSEPAAEAAALAAAERADDERSFAIAAE